ncbi:unnamed protein product [Ceratitis capitata]|uniref:type I protein arginine methyltransferase n=1 Tax=Ceratitis capitata TaxID=7213 RepID=A0A811UCB4_CERCA|nr:unnamed protein product [Ceratitis capitata]
MAANFNNIVVNEGVERNNSSSSLNTLVSSGRHSKNNSEVFIITNNGEGSSANNGGLGVNGTCNFSGVVVSEVSDETNLKFSSKYKNSCTLICIYDPQGVILKITEENNTSNVLKEYLLAYDTESAQIGRQTFALSLDNDNLLLRFTSAYEQQRFRKLVDSVKHLRPKSVFSQRTEESSASQYFQFYGYLSQQQNMMQDYVRTSTYQRAILGNSIDFHNKIVLDVGAGSGILSFFAVQAGAAKVYAIEASNMAQYAQQLVDSNNVQEKIFVMPGKIEEIDIPEMVDVIISEPMGICSTMSACLKHICTLENG